MAGVRFADGRSRREVLTSAGAAAFAVLGSALVDLRRADAKEKKRSGRRTSPRPEAPPDDTERLVGELERLTNKYVDTIERLLKDSARFPSSAPSRTLAREIVQLTQAFLTGAAIITRGTDDATPALDAQNLHFAVWDANERKQHDKRIASSINVMWTATSARAVAESYAPHDDPVIESAPKEG